MVRTILALHTTLLVLTCTSAHAGLVAHFRFDGDLKDATGRHDGRPVDAKLAPGFAPGRVGSAVVIERANAGIEAANPSAIDFSRDFTIAAWVNVGSYYAECPVLFKLRADKTSAQDKFFGLFGIDGLQVHGEWVTNFRASNGLVPNDGQWHHVAVIRFSAFDTAAAIYFNPGWTRLPSTAYRPFYSQGQMVTPYYWGNHLPLARRKPTSDNIDNLAYMTPAHNAPMSWGHRRPQPLESRIADMPDALGVTRPMQVEKWTWLLGLSDADDTRLLEWSRSFATPPQFKADGARLQSPAYNTERRATLLTVERPTVSITIKPATPCVHPVFELHQAPQTLKRVELNGRVLAANDYAWDGRTFWLNTTLRHETTLRLVFGNHPQR